MIKYRLVVVLVCALLSLPVLSKQRISWFEDGRYGEDCPKIYTPTIKGLPVCKPSIIRLIARPEDYHNKLVKVTGYLVRESGSYALYASQGNYQASNGEGGIAISNPAELSPRLRELAKKGLGGVTVIGRIDAKSSSRLLNSVGQLVDIKTSYDTTLRIK
jgi:hypothetical protein